MGRSVTMIRPAHHGGEVWLSVRALLRTSRSVGCPGTPTTTQAGRQHSTRRRWRRDPYPGTPRGGESSTRSPCVAFRPCRLLARNGLVLRIAVFQRHVHESHRFKGAAGVRRRGHSEVQVFPRCCPPLSATAAVVGDQPVRGDEPTARLQDPECVGGQHVLVVRDVDVSLSVAVTKADDAGNVRLVKRGMQNQVRDDCAAALVLAAGTFSGAPPPRRRLRSALVG